MSLNKYIVCVSILLCAATAGATHYPQHYTTPTAESPFGTYRTADEFHTILQLGTQAEEPNESDGAYGASARRKPGGGTGIIPNQAPIGDSILFLLLAAFCYGLYLKQREKSKALS